MGASSLALSLPLSLSLSLAIDSLGLPLLMAVLVGLVVGGDPRTGPGWRRDLAGVFSLATAWIVGHIAVMGWPSFVPLEATDRLLLISAVLVVIGGVIVLLEARRDPRHSGASPWGSALIRAVVLAGLAFVLLASKRQYLWTGVESALWTTGIAVVGAASWTAVGSAANRLRPAAWRGGLSLWSLVVAGALAGTGSVVYGQLGGALAMGFGTATLLSLAARSGSSGRALLWLGVPLVLGMIVLGTSYSSLPLIGALGLALLPACLRLLPAGQTG